MSMLERMRGRRATLRCRSREVILVCEYEVGDDFGNDIMGFSDRGSGTDGFGGCDGMEGLTVTACWSRHRLRLRMSREAVD